MREQIKGEAMQGDKALQLINEHREVLGGALQVEALEKEFPYLAADLAREVGAHGLLLARADENAAGTFKLRGAFIGTYHQREQGITRRRLYSAGNFANGAAYAGALLEVETNIFVPYTAPFEKQDGLYRFGQPPLIRVYGVGATLEETEREMLKHDELGHTFHPFNDPAVITGQGTIADDLLEAVPDIQHVVVPIGGGGLLAGLRQRFDELGRQDVILHAIEAPGSNSMSQSIRHRRLTAAEHPNLKYGGSAVKHVGTHALRICLEAGERIQVSQVTEADIDNVVGAYAQSRRDLWRETIPAYEPTTLVAVAGLRDIAKQHPHDVIAVVGTGHNAPLSSYV